MARLRLRFLLQEFDLVGPELVIGRSPDCQITIEDPMVSRHHACIRVVGTKAYISDMGSRNGVRINGQLISTEGELKDGDRIRLGTQDLVFTVAREQERLSRTTGYLRMCGACGTPYPDQSPQCPHCGHQDTLEEDTMSGVFPDRHSMWELDLLHEVIQRAMVKGRFSDVHRMLTRVTEQISDRSERLSSIPHSQMEKVAEFAVKLANETASTEWLIWVFETYRVRQEAPTRKILHALRGLSPSSLTTLHAQLNTYLNWFQQETDVSSRPSFNVWYDQFQQLDQPRYL